MRTSAPTEEIPGFSRSLFASADSVAALSDSVTDLADIAVVSGSTVAEVAGALIAIGIVEEPGRLDKVVSPVVWYAPIGPPRNQSVNQYILQAA